ncbi:uncharacterized protein LOC108666483 [Hyalella azteca]|uniref:Uncharacterized protein LOC108666483 n=1 Tax=Hyalella azteca TaxID=294128 RepID=A0A8B7N6E3_HYAAZ|nr:uncharacterized protein LOC108666483 [Hyalella azteca]
MKLLLVLFTVMAAAASYDIIDDKLVNGYGRMAVMRDCFGDREYARYTSRVKAAEGTCRSRSFQPQTQPFLTTAPVYRRPSYESDDDQFYDRKRVHELSIKTRARFSNATCVLRELGYIDGSYNIQYQTMIDEIKDVGRIDKQLMTDLISGINQCKDFATCLPTERIQYPMTVESFRYISFSNCRHHATLFACLKRNARQQRRQEDYTGPDNIVDTATEDEKIIAMLWAEAKVNSF